MIYSIIFSFYWVRVGKNCGKKFYKLSALRSEFCDVFSRFLRVYDTTMAFYDQPFVTFRIFAAVDSNFPYPLQFVQYFRLFQTQPLVRHFNFKLDEDAASFLKSGNKSAPWTGNIPVRPYESSRACATVEYTAAVVTKRNSATKNVKETKKNHAIQVKQFIT